MKTGIRNIVKGKNKIMEEGEKVKQVCNATDIMGNFWGYQ
tara:strand:+ start:41 stop:160 length:120 start_codon:yes stop_codon:yes gene_type:complete